MLRTQQLLRRASSQSAAADTSRVWAHEGPFGRPSHAEAEDEPADDDDTVHGASSSTANTTSAAWWPATVPHAAAPAPPPVPACWADAVEGEGEPSAAVWQQRLQAVAQVRPPAREQRTAGGGGFVTHVVSWCVLLCCVVRVGESFQHYEDQLAATRAVTALVGRQDAPPAGSGPAAAWDVVATLRSELLSLHREYIELATTARRAEETARHAMTTQDRLRRRVQVPLDTEIRGFACH